MKPFIQYMKWTLCGSTVFVLAGITFFTIGHQPFLYSLLYGTASGAAVSAAGLWNAKRLFLKKHRLTRKEYVYIKENLEEARGKIIRLRRALFRSKSIQMLKQNAEILRITRRIYLLTKQEPKRFYQAERFYYQTLDSVVELTEKYALLSSQPRKNKDLSMSLSDTRVTLAELSRRLEEDLHELMKEDIDDLHFELDVAKHSLRK
ncbi:5-bromo-4-chloroindolyl phosphate hydrolysis family protein [Bacillus velezensis]|uniref:5-bromo-4-chloroindolyl phosphate hydrolysis family protein n=1 Tax=Bacillus velezensis TaxID=492670 RepID=UPI0005CE2F5A|nr:5-bromo-4-chloroindolyl phosphate hydrolysis family protein [Bacillus velezensis]KJD56257.1 protein xpaC [Bacillus amyloliquefaciens]OQV45768.1 protein xpaC [Bacillus velezensis]WHM02089.1 5-bromo-4-chloroindolyl phosphate hydrolysis family protein [Bacillus velezensis]